VTNSAENLVLERLCRIDDGLQDICGNLKDIKLRMTAAEEHLLSIQTSVLALNSRMDRFDVRLERVERRLDIKDAS
jgi:hypothetical protein